MFSNIWSTGGTLCAPITRSSTARETCPESSVPKRLKIARKTHCVLRPTACNRSALRRKETHLKTQEMFLKFKMNLEMNVILLLTSYPPRYTLQSIDGDGQLFVQKPR